MDQMQINKLKRELSRLNGHVAMLSAIIAHAIDVNALKHPELRALATRLEPDDPGIGGAAPEVSEHAKHLLERLGAERSKLG